MKKKMLGFIAGLTAAAVFVTGLPARSFAAEGAADAVATTESDALKQRVADAIEKSASQKQLGCKAIIGCSLDKTVVIYEDVHYDGNILHEVMTHVEDSTDKELYRFENYYDNAAGVYYKDGGKGEYRFAFGNMEDSMYEYLSLDFYLDYLPKGDYAYEGKRNVEIPDGTTVECDVISVSKELEDRFAPIDSTAKYLVLSDAASTETVAKEGSLAYEPESGNEVIILKDEYAIGADGLLYSVGRVSTKPVFEHSTDHRFYYPTQNVSIPEGVEENSEIAENAVVDDGELIYLSYYKNDKPYLAVYDYTGKTPKDVVVPAKVEIRGKKYTVGKVAAKAFYNMGRLESIKLPATVKKIGKKAFISCDALKKIVVKNKALRNKLKKDRKLRDKVCIYSKKIIFAK